MSPKREEWSVDPDGNLTSPDGLSVETDEFGRDDPAALERERRRREREMQRGGSGNNSKPPKPERKPRRRRSKKAEPPATPPAAEAAPPTRERPAAPGQPIREPPAAETAAAAPQAGRRSMRERMARRSDGKPPGPPTKTYWRRRIAAMVLALVGILVAWFLIALFQPFAGDGEGEGSVTVEIPEGADSGEIADILDQRGVISSASLFELRLRLSGKGDDIQADSYSLAESMSYSTVIDRLTGGQQGGAITVTIPEGLSRDQIAADVLPEGVSSDEYLELTETAPSSFNTKRYGATGDSLEGFLFPATYDLAEGQGSAALVDQQLQAFRDNVSQVDLSYAKKKNLTAYDVLIIASMIDKEVLVPREREVVASVIYNRLSQGIPLGIDATTRYETENYTEPILQSQLDADTPYNTRLNAGLPPTPIGNPGLAAIKAAARPANTGFIFFVVKPGTCGEHSFTASAAEFEQLDAEYKAALEAEGGSPTEC